MWEGMDGAGEGLWGWDAGGEGWRAGRDGGSDRGCGWMRALGEHLVQRARVSVQAWERPAPPPPPPLHLFIQSPRRAQCCKVITEPSLVGGHTPRSVRAFR